MNSDNQWHLSKSVPITFILSIMAQTIALIWFVATLRNDVDHNSVRIERISIAHETRLETLENIVQTQSVLLARIDENLKGIRSVLEEFKDDQR